MRRLAPWSVALALGLALVAVAPDVAPARTRATHTAGVTVAYGDGRVVRRTASFAAESISGIEALQAAGFDVEAYGYGGLGAAVCRIDGVGRDPDMACLNGGAHYWAYWRNGTYSSVGAGATRVTDGDQEQWAWGSGAAAPPTTAFPSPTTAAPPPPPPTEGPVSTTASRGSGVVVGGSSTSAPSSTTTTERGSTSVTTTEPEQSRGTGESRVAAEEDGDDPESAAGQLTSTRRSSDGDSGGGSPLALGGFALVLAAVVGLTLKARGARGDAPPRN